MCGRYRRKSDRQRIADAFEVSAGLDDIDLAPEDDIAPGSNSCDGGSNCPTVFSSTPAPKASRFPSSGRMPFSRPRHRSCGRDL